MCDVNNCDLTRDAMHLTFNILPVKQKTLQSKITHVVVSLSSS